MKTFLFPAFTAVASCLCAQTEWDIILETPANPGPEIRYYGQVYEPNTSSYVTENVLDAKGFTWFHGQAHTVAASLVAFFDANGYPNLIIGNNSPTEVLLSDYDSVASEEHVYFVAQPWDQNEEEPIEDNWITEEVYDSDEIGGSKHPKNSVADFCWTSVSSEGLTYGQTPNRLPGLGARSYFLWKYPELSVAHSESTVYQQSLLTDWLEFKEKIDSGLPCLMTVDSDAYGDIDTELFVVGYRIDAANKKFIIAYNGLDSDAHVYPFEAAYALSAGEFVPLNIPFGIGLITYLEPSENNLRVNMTQFYRKDLGAYFFSANKEETELVATWDDVFELQEVPFVIFTYQAQGSVPLYRFRHLILSTHFYSSNPVEIETVRNTLQDAYVEEGIVGYVYNKLALHTQPVYRFLHIATGSHFFTASEKVRDEKIRSDPTLQYEGIGFWALGT